MARICLIFVIWVSCLQLIAQELKQSVDSNVIRYMQQSGGSSALYYGNEYEGYPRTTNHPFLKDIQFEKTQLSYQNVVYPEVWLRLDLNRDELIVRSPTLREIVLFPQKVDFAILHGLHVFYFQNDSLPGCPSGGYYILLYSGKCKVLEKINAPLLEKTTTNRLDRYFEFSSQYYLFLDGKYYNIKGKNGLLNVLQPYKKELKQFISSRKLSLRNQSEQFLIQTIGEYERISN